MIAQGKKVYVNYELEKELKGEREFRGECIRDMLNVFSFHQIIETITEEVKAQELNYLIENVRGDIELVLNCSMEEIVVRFLNYLKNSKKKIKITTTFGSAEMEDIYLCGIVDYVGSNYVLLKEACINNNLPTKGTYFSHKDTPGEAIIFVEDIYSLFVLEDEDEKEEKDYNIAFTLQGTLKIKAKNEEELKNIMMEKISNIENLIKGEVR